MNILNYLIFFLIGVLSLKYIFSPVEAVKDPFREDRAFPVTGVQRFFLLVLSVGILQLGTLMVPRLFTSIVFCLIAVFYDRNPFRLNIVSWLYLIFLCWLTCAILYSPVKAYGIRVFLKYSYPFLILILASKITSSGAFTFKAAKIILRIGLIGSLFILILSRIPFINQLSWSLFWWPPAILDFMPVAICIALSFWLVLKKKRYGWYTLFFVLPSIVGVNRTGLLAASIAIVMFLIVRYQIKSIPYVILGIALFLGIILYVPGFKDKMFKKDLTTEEIIENRDNLTSEDIDSSGRFAMWDWSLGKFYKGNELTGSGLGVLQDAFYNTKHPFGSLKVVHNDYVQLLCDSGLIGLILYASVFISLFIHSMLLAWRKNTPLSLRFLAFVAGPAMAGVAVSLYTDNAVNYSLMTLSYPFAVYGMLVGLQRKQSIIREI